MSPDNLSTIGSIATHLIEIFPNISAGISGNMIEIVDMARQHVENYVGQTIGSNSIDAKYQPAILDYAKADIIDLDNAQAGGERISLAELSIDDSGNSLSAEQYRILGDIKLRTLGKSIKFAKSLS